MNRFVSLLSMAWAPLWCMAAQEASTVLPQNYKVILEEPYAKVIHVHYGPHEKVLAHDHPATPTVYVYLNDSGPVRFIHEGEGGFTVIRKPTHVGAFRVNQGTIEQHSVENLGSQDSDFLRIELTGTPLGDKQLNGRGSAPADLSHNFTATEFSAPGLTIVRNICAGRAPCPVGPAPVSSLIIALSDMVPVRNAGEGSDRLMMKTGDVVALAPHAAVTITTEQGTSAHILQINIEKPAAAKL